MAIKGHALADFIQEATYEGWDQRPWALFVDGSAIMRDSGAIMFIRNPEGNELEFAIKLDFKASNNEAEYEALIRGLETASQLGGRDLRAFSDSQLVVQQFREKFEAQEEKMAQYVRKVQTLMSSFAF